MAYKIPTIPGDGIGPEVINEGKKVLDAASEVEGFEIEWIEYPFGADHYLSTGKLLTEDDLRELGKYKAIYFGAIGDPRVETGVLEIGILLKIRFYFDEYVNLRPVKLYDGVPCPLRDKGPEHVNFVIVRENTEDFYVGLGGRLKGIKKENLELVREIYRVRFGIDADSGGEEIAYQMGVISRKGAERVIRYAFELARKERRKKVTCVDKANVLVHSYGLWRDVFSEVSKEYPDIQTEYSFVDAMTMWMVKNPEWYDVIVAPNMFGDIITDLGAMIQGGLGLAPGANINPNGTSMFEPIHGSAPKYRGMGIANPIATILAGKMLLEFLGEKGAAERVERAVAEVLREGRVRTKDLGGNSRTWEVGDEIARKIREG